MVLENLRISMNSVLPMFLIMALGYLCRALGMLNDSEIKRLNTVVFYFFIPVLLFCNIYESNIEALLDVKLILYVYGMIAAGFLISFVVTTIFEKERYNKGALLHGSFRGNTTLLGLPIAVGILGADHVGLISVIIAAIAPIMNVLGIVSLEMYRGQKLNIKHMIKGILLNPLIIATAISLALNFGHVHMPIVINSTLTSLKQVASPLSMFVLGASFNFQSIGKNRRNIAIATILKLMVIPAIAISFGIMMGFRGDQLVSLLVVFSAPTAVMSFSMAQNMGSNGELAGNIVVFTSILSSFTIFITVFIFNTFSLI